MYVRDGGAVSVVGLLVAGRDLVVLICVVRFDESARWCHGPLGLKW